MYAIHFTTSRNPHNSCAPYTKVHQIVIYLNSLKVIIIIYFRYEIFFVNMFKNELYMVKKIGSHKKDNILYMYAT